MSKTIRNLYDKKLFCENLMKAHIESRKGKIQIANVKTLKDKLFYNGNNL